MRSGATQLAQRITNGANDAGDAVLSPMQQTLLSVDQIIASLSAVVLLVVIARRVVQRRPRFAGIPFRNNTVREDAVALAVASYLLAVVTLSGVVALIGLDPMGDVATLLVGVGGQAIGIVACLLLARRRFDGGASGCLFGTNASRSTSVVPVIVFGTFVGVGLCPVIAEWSVIGLHWLDPNFVVPDHPTLLALHRDEVSTWLVLMLWVGAGGVAPLAEEIFFRGLVQTMLANVLGERWVAVVLTSIAFGLVHYPQPHAMPALIFLSLILGYAYERTGTLIVPVAIHALFNLKTLLWETLGSAP